MEDSSRPFPYPPVVVGLRPFRGPMYVLLAISGIVLMIVSYPVITPPYHWTAHATAVFLILGGVVSAVGHMLHSLVLERAGYPLFMTALVSLAVLLFLTADANPVRVVYGLLLLAFSLGLFGRWRDLGIIRKVRDTVLRKGPGDDSE